MRERNFQGSNAWIAVLANLLFPLVSLAQSHYDHWTLLPEILLRYDGSSLQFHDTLTWSFGDECDETLTYSDPFGNLRLFGSSGLVLNDLGDTIHWIPSEIRNCYNYNSISVLPIVRGVSLQDTTHFSFTYTKDVWGSFGGKVRYKSISLDSLGRFSDSRKEHQGTLLMSNPGWSQTLPIRHANGRDWWILVLEPTVDSDQPFRDHQWNAYLTTGDSIRFMGIAGVMDSIRGAGEAGFSRSGDRVCMATGKDLRIMDFDRCSGHMSNLETISEGYVDLASCSFSPDGTKLYAGNRKRSLYVFDLETPGYPMDTVFQGAGIFGYETMNLELGPDDRLYWGFELHTGFGAVDPTRYLMRVENPDADFDDLVFDTFAVYLNGFQNRTNAFPNFPNYELGRLVGSPCDTLFSDTTTSISTTLPVPDWQITPSVSQTNFRVLAQQPLRWEVFAMTGERYASGTAERIDVTTWPQGIYIIQLSDATKQKRIKVVRP